MTLLNNTRLDYSAPPPTPFIADTPEECLSFCVNTSWCGGMVFKEPYEPLPVGGCEGKAPQQGCCYPAPLVDAYQIFGPGTQASYGFVSAIVRYGPPTPPWGIPPTWMPSYLMNRSISLYWRNASGLEPAELYDGYGLVMLDWAHAAQDWINNYQPMDTAAALARQCEIIKARSPSTKCVVYRNTAIALNQNRHISSVLDDPAFSDFFLKFKPGATQTGPCWGEEDPRQRGSPWDPIWPTPAVCQPLLPSDVHVPMCDKANLSKCSRVHYFDQNQVPQVPGINWSNDTQDVYQGLACLGGDCNCGANVCGEYLFNFSTPEMIDWWLLEHFGGGLGLDHPSVDGVLTDDYWAPSGPSEIDSNMLADMGMSAQDAVAQTAAYNGAMSRLFDLVRVRNKFISVMGYSGDSLSTANAAQCAARLASACSATAPILGHWFVVDATYIQPPEFGIHFTNPVMDVAYFLLTRGPYAWIAGGPMLGWHMSHWWTANKTRRISFHDLRLPEFNEDFGEPTCTCSQTAPGVFQRDWTKASVTVDCNVLKGSIVMK
jgi:hypothetical protein